MYGYYENLAEKLLRSYEELKNKRRRGAIAVRRAFYNSTVYRQYFDTEEPLQIYWHWQSEAEIPWVARSFAGQSYRNI